MVGSVSESVYVDSGSVDSVETKNVGKAIIHEVEKVSLNVLQGAKCVFTGLGTIHMKVNPFSQFLELGGFGFAVAQLATGNNTGFSGMIDRIVVTKDVIGGIQGLEGVNYFCSKELKKESIFKTLGNSMMMLASVGGIAEILDRCKLINLSGIADKIGSVPVLGKVVQGGIGYGQMISGFVGFGYGCFGAEAIDRLVNAETSDQKRQASLDIAWFVAEVAAKVFIVFASAYLGGVIALSAVAATLGIVSYLHRVDVEEKAAEEKVRAQHVS